MRREISTLVNGETYESTVPTRLLLADFLRETLGLRGTHLGCEHGVCGACTVLFDGEPVRSCLMFAVQAVGHSVRTVESLSDGNGLSQIQEAFRKRHALQCGFCTPGILMTAEFLFESGAPLDTEEDIREALAGNMCRCTGYQNIVDAIAEVAGRETPNGERND